MKLWRVDDVMTSDVVAVREDTPYREVVNVLIGQRISAVPVLDRFDHVGRLVGIVTRSDLLKVHLRSDAEIRHDVVEEVFRRILSLGPGQIQAMTTDGVVTLGGRTHFRSTADKAVRLTGQVPGVVGVVDELGYDLDDRLAVGSEVGAPFGVA